jgi:hypothetical protein
LRGLGDRRGLGSRRRRGGRRLLHFRRRLVDLGERLLDPLAHLLDADAHQRRHVVIAFLALGKEAKHRLLVVRQPHRGKPTRAARREGVPEVKGDIKA